MSRPCSVRSKGLRPIRTTPATRRCVPPPGHDYTAALRRGGLKGARIGIPRAFFYDRAGFFGGEGPGLTRPELQARVMADAVAALRKEGAVVVDPAKHPERCRCAAREQFSVVGDLRGRCIGPLA